MRRAGRLFDRVVDSENLRLAFWKASRGKHHREDQQLFETNLNDELRLLAIGLRTGRYPIGDYCKFKIHEPKHLANLYLDGVDRLCGEKSAGYVRYMDDFVVWSNDKEALKTLRGNIRRFVERELGLSLKGECVINMSVRGMDFLGCRIVPFKILPSRRRRTHVRREIRNLERAYDEGKLAEGDLQCRVTALSSFMQVRQNASRRFRTPSQGQSGSRAFIAAAVGTTPRRIAAPQGGTATNPGTAGTTTASASPARSTAGGTVGPERRPASGNAGTKAKDESVRVGNPESHDSVFESADSIRIQLETYGAFLSTS